MLLNPPAAIVTKLLVPGGGMTSLAPQASKVWFSVRANVCTDPAARATMFVALAGTLVSPY